MVSLWHAPFLRPLRVQDLSAVPTEARLVLAQLGIDEGETLEKRHVAPLGDPVTHLLGAHQFTLRRELCLQIQVKEAR